MMATNLLVLLVVATSITAADPVKRAPSLTNNRRSDEFEAQHAMRCQREGRTLRTDALETGYRLELCERNITEMQATADNLLRTRAHLRSILADCEATRHVNHEGPYAQRITASIASGPVGICMEENANIESRLKKVRRAAVACEWRLRSLQIENRYAQEDIDETARQQDACTRSQYPEG